MSDLADRAEAVRRGAGLFRLPGRGVARVAGSDRIRWLDGMVTNDVKALAARGPGAGTYALLLTPQGRIVADLHLLLDDECVWLETERAALPGVLERLDRYLIADDVTLADESEAVVRAAVEGARAAEVLAAAGAALALAPDDWAPAELAGAPARVAAWGFTGLPAFQLFLPAASADAALAALAEAGRGAGLVPGDAALLECLRVEAGTPWLGRELDESVLPAEARLDRAVSTTKGCYTGQEVVARMRSRDRRNQLLVGLRFEGGALPEPGTRLEETDGGGRGVGEVTSAVHSPRHGPIGLGYVRHDRATAGAALRAGSARAHVVELPFAEA